MPILDPFIEKVRDITVGEGRGELTGPGNLTKPANFRSGSPCFLRVVILSDNNYEFAPNRSEFFS